MDSNIVAQKGHGVVVVWDMIGERSENLLLMQTQRRCESEGYQHAVFPYLFE